MTKQECRQVAMEIIKILKEEGYTITKTSDILEETGNKEEFLKTFNNSDDDIKVSLSKEEIESLTADNHELLKKIYHVKKNYRIENSDNVDEFTMQQSQLAFTLGVFFYNDHIPAITNVLSKKYTNYQDFNRIYAGISTILNEITLLYNVDRKKLYNDYILIDILFDLMMSTTKYVSEIIPVVMENIETWKNNMILGVDLTIYKKELMPSNEFRFTMYRLFLKLVYDKEFIYPEFFKNKIENINRFMRDEFDCEFKHFTSRNASKDQAVESELNTPEKMAEFKSTEDPSMCSFINTVIGCSKRKRNNRGKDRFSNAEIIDLLHLDLTVNYGDDAFTRWCDNMELVLGNNNVITTQQYVPDMRVKIGINEQQFESLNEKMQERRNTKQPKEKLYVIHNFIIDFIKAHHSTIAKSLYDALFTVSYDMFVDNEERNYDIIKEIFTDTWNRTEEDPDLIVISKTQPILCLCIYRLMALKTINNIRGVILSND